MSFAPPGTTDPNNDEPLEMEVVSRSSPPITAGELIAWFAIAGFTMLLFVTNLLESGKDDEQDIDAPPMEVTNAEIMGKFAFAFREMAEKFGSSTKDAIDIVKEMDSGSLEQRYCMVLALNDMDSHAAAFKKLDEIDDLVAEEDYTPTERQVRLRDLVERVLIAHEEGTTPSMSDDDRGYLLSQLRWFGKLALNPREAGSEDRQAVADQAWWSMSLLMVAAGLAVLFLACGLIGLIAFVVLLASGRIQSDFQPASGAGSIYAETFAIWLIGFFAAQFAIAFLIQRLGLGLHEQMVALPLAFFLSLGALIWPVLRGVEFGQVRRDIGWTFSRPFGDTARGTAVYASATPLMGLALLITVSLAGLFSPIQGETHELAGGQAPAHPIVGYIASGDWFVIAMIFVATCIAAPIVEETMFRGVLFRSLRDRTSGTSTFVSVIVSAGLNSLIFAAIHPQGLMGLPVLTVLAMAFSMMRQWRNSLIGPIFMHALNNFLVTSFAVMLMT